LDNGVFGTAGGRTVKALLSPKAKKHGKMRRVEELAEIREEKPKPFKFAYIDRAQKLREEQVLSPSRNRSRKRGIHQRIHRRLGRYNGAKETSSGYAEQNFTAQ
jgi:hypothetical protein